LLLSKSARPLPPPPNWWWFRRAERRRYSSDCAEKILPKGSRPGRKRVVGLALGCGHDSIRSIFDLEGSMAQRRVGQETFRCDPRAADAPRRAFFFDRFWACGAKGAPPSARAPLRNRLTLDCLAHRCDGDWFGVQRQGGGAKPKSRAPADDYAPIRADKDSGSSAPSRRRRPMRPMSQSP
jgi:hypothetical protein